MEKFIKKCPICKLEIEYKNNKALSQSIIRNSKCKNCNSIDISLRHTGKKFTKEHKKNLSKAKEKYKDFYRDRLIQINKNKKGKSLSETHKKNLSISKIGDKNPTKQKWVREKISNSLKIFHKNNPDATNNNKPWNINQYSDKFTDIELNVKNILDELQINSIHNKKIGRFWADFTIGNKIIEVDGEYWHNKEKDDKKDKFLIENGYIILRLKGKEIKKNINIIREKIIKFLK